jgi:glyoxylase-like metal-dependent hydrolase (beta-lactamase superfamily II)
MELILLKLSVTVDYLFRAGGKYVLVDTGYAADWPLLRRRLGEAGVSPEDLGFVILTHHHDDHVGCLGELVAANPGLVVVMSRLTEELLHAGRNDLTHGGGLINRRIAFLIRFKRFLVAFKTGSLSAKEDNLRFTPYLARSGDIIFDGETTLRELGIDSEGVLVPTPGHTVDSVSLLFPDGGCLVGDAAADMLSFAGTRHCVIFVMDLAMYYGSWRLLLSRGARRIFPAHGRPFASAMLERDIGRNRAEDVVGYGDRTPRPAR